MIARAEALPNSFRVHMPSDIDVPAIRKRLGLSQNEFSARHAARLGAEPPPTGTPGARPLDRMRHVPIRYSACHRCEQLIAGN